MNDGAFFKSNRHAAMADEFPPEPAPWQKPSPRTVGCTGPCDQGRQPCPTFEACYGADASQPETQPMVYAEPSRFDVDGKRLLCWLVGVPAVVLIVGLVAALWP